MNTLKAFYFEIIKHRLTRSAKTIQRVPFPQLPPIVTSYITIVNIKTKKLTPVLLTRLQPLFSFHHFLNLNSFFFLAAPQGMRDPIRGRTHAPRCIGSAESQALACQGSPNLHSPLCV